MGNSNRLDMLTVSFNELADEAVRAKELEDKVRELEEENRSLREQESENKNGQYTLSLEGSVNQSLIEQVEKNAEHLPSDLRRNELVAYGQGQEAYQQLLESNPEYMQDVTTNIEEEYQDIKNWMNQLSKEQRETVIEDPDMFVISYKRALMDSDTIFPEKRQKETAQRNLEQALKLNEYRTQKTNERYQKLEKGLDGINEHTLTVGYSVQGEDGEIVLPSTQESTLNSLVLPVILESWGEHSIPRETPRRDMISYDRILFKTDADLLQHGKFKDSYTQNLEQIGFNVKTEVYMQGEQ